MEIPLGARIFPLCDAFDAMTSDRPYRRALALHKALDEICNGDGTQFWSEAVDAFMSIPRDALQNVMRERRRGPS
jgi:HD-GYP domain-containing protein (c-di-GMP phosphodiesterase class II)